MAARRAGASGARLPDPLVNADFCRDHTFASRPPGPDGALGDGPAAPAAASVAHAPLKPKTYGEFHDW